jgi:hypothetical protein
MSHDAQQNPGFTRRTMLRNGLLVGVGTAAVVGASVPIARSARAAVTAPASIAPGGSAQEQFNWVFCSVCNGIFYCGGNHKSRGWCPGGFDGQPHADTPSSYNSYDYGFFYDGDVGGGWQGDWFWCHICSGMFWGKDGNTSYGVCPSGGGQDTHDGSQSYNSYLVYSGGPAAGFQPGWFHCSQCSGLFYGGTYNFGGTCPIDDGDGPDHDGTGSYSYYMPWNGTEITLGS